MSSIKNKYKKPPCKPPSLLTDAVPGRFAVSPVKLKSLKHRAQALLLDVEFLLAKQPFPVDGPVDFYEEVKQFEINLILWALEQTGGEQKKAARLLGLKTTTLNAMISRYELNKETEVADLKDLMYAIDCNSKGPQ